MIHFLYTFFHNETNDRSEKGTIFIPDNDDEWPEVWKKIEYKTYPSSSLIIPIVSPQGGFWSNFLIKRSSTRARQQTQKVTFEQISYMLSCGYGLINHVGDEKRSVPSAGSRYPLELYLALNSEVNTIPAGLYHYSVKEQLIEFITGGDQFSGEYFAKFSPYSFLENKNGVIIITSVFPRIINKYGNRGYRYALLEAGHVAQNIILAGLEKGVDVVPIGGFNEDVAERALGIEGTDERVVYALYF